MLELREYADGDAQIILSWIDGEYAFRQWSADRYGEYPITADCMNASYAALKSGGGFFPFTAVEEGIVRGHLIVRFTDSEKKRARLGFVIVDSKVRGRGYGKELISLALERAFGRMNAESVSIVVFENNPKAYNCYKSAGLSPNPERDEIYDICGERWKGLYLETDRLGYERLKNNCVK